MRKTTIAIAALILSLAAPLALAVQPNVRVIHASPDAPAVDILVNDEIRAFQNVEFSQATDSAELPASVYNIKVVPAGGSPDSAVIEADLNLTWFTNYTVIALDTVANIAPMVLADQDPSLILPDRAWLRFLHASPDAPAVDLRVAGGPYLFENISFMQLGDYIQVPAGARVDIEVLLAGTESVVLVVPGVALEGSKSYTALAVGFAGGGEPGLGALLAEDGGSGFPFRIETGGDDEGETTGGGEVVVIGDEQEEEEEEDDDDEDDEEDELESRARRFLERTSRFR